ncbi:L-seryl-tRNA(Sec) kinase [Holothuria leucospilota]|uniref:L-seryl-tRNA(Sec) kinase n=1 Tax=Holothuria leucospilota TaxID=206669 RepID=A0A9Q0YND7_HOLLE|nr:L-seryl-tRNA(Sec) kinase [Holothuria leucospilota]
MASSVCLTLISGIPASGKTTLAEIFVEFVHSIPFDLHVLEEKGRLKVIHIPFDDVIPNNLQLEEESPSSTWRQCRKKIVSYMDDILDSLITKQLTLVEAYSYLQTKNASVEGQTKEEIMVFNNLQQVLWRQLKLESSTANKKPLATIFILDDNFFYRSMRYEYFQLARNHSIGFCQVHITCPYQVASCRNKQRSSPITEETYVNMMAKLEEPDSSKASWEIDYLLVDGETEFNHLEVSQIWGLVQYALENPVPPIPEEDDEEKELSRVIGQTSILHQADQILRKCVSESMLKAKNYAQETCDLKSFASKVNQARTSLLDSIREGAIGLPPLTVAGENKGENVKNEEFERALQKLYHNSLNS